MELWQKALVGVGTLLHERGYTFVTPTPETHRRWLARRTGTQERPTRSTSDEGSLLRTLRELFGWNVPVPLAALPAALRGPCEAAGLWELTSDGQSVVSRVRFSTVDGPAVRGLFVHSGFPTTSHDAVFFGPDTYRFVAAIRRNLSPARVLVDVGCGTGAGGLALADRSAKIVLSDVSPRALTFARVNLALAHALGRLDDERRVELRLSDVLAGVEPAVDVDTVIANPPYLVDPANRLYRDGGGRLGTDLAARIVEESLGRLVSQSPRARRGAQILLYTGVPIVEGHNVLAQQLEPALSETGAQWSWEEIDPDVFGEELVAEAYRETERLAAVSLTIKTEASPSA